MLHFAQISDIHFSKDGNQGFGLFGESPKLFARAIEHLNGLADLDFVLISGDCLNNAHRQELAQFQDVLATLKKQAFIIPGNHDGNLVDDPQIFTQRHFASIFNPQFQERSESGQAGYFSVTVKTGVQLIGLDTSITGQTGGTIDQTQLDWIAQQFEQHRDKFVIVACHHPLVPLTEKDKTGKWQDWFVCDQADQVLQLFNAYPAVKLVLCGHHHMNKILRCGGQLHIAAPALVSYPCAYRRFWLERNEQGHHIAWQTEPAPPEIEAWAGQLLHDSDFTLEFDPHNPQAFVDAAKGNQFEWQFEGNLEEISLEDLC